MIKVLTKNLKEEDAKYNCSRRMLLCAIELSKFGAECKSKIAIKTQALSDFLPKCTFK